MQRKRICEGDFMELKCDNEHEVLFIHDAMYGRTMDASVCPGIDRTPTTDCISWNSVERVQLFCQHQHECKIGVSMESFLVEPCEGVNKYLDVNYTCGIYEPTIDDVCKYANKNQYIRRSQVQILDGQ